MKTRTLVYAGLGGLALFGFALARSKQKCNRRRRALIRAYPGKTDEELRAISKTLGITYPDCSGIPIIREGI